MISLAQADRGPANVALLTVGCLLLGVLVTGVILCAVRMRRPGAVRKCYGSFILFAAGWLLCGAISSIGKTSGNAVASSLAGLLVFAAMGIPAVILAILGLSEVRRAGPGATGKAPAVTTLVFAALALVFIIGAFGLGVLKGVTKSAEFRAELAPREGSPEPAEVFREQGFSIQPPRPWIKIDAGQLNREAAVGYLRSRPQVYFMIIAEKLEKDSELDLRTLVDVVKANLAGAAQESKLIEEKEESLNGVAGIRLVYEATIEKQAFTYRYWIHRAPSCAFQLVAWGTRGDGAAVVAEAAKAFDSFRLLQPK